MLHQNSSFIILNPTEYKTAVLCCNNSNNCDTVTLWQTFLRFYYKDVAKDQIIDVIFIVFKKLSYNSFNYKLFA